jgi:hypothetical protein
LRTIKLKKKGYGSKSATSIFKFVHAFGCWETWCCLKVCCDASKWGSWEGGRRWNGH